MWMVAASFFRRTQSKSVGLVWGLAATQRSVCVHQMNWVNSRTDFGCDDSTINIVVVIIIIITVIACIRMDEVRAALKKMKRHKAPG